MNAREKETVFKLDILHSLARSQRALAAILEQIALIAADDETVRRGLRVNLEAISRYQRALAEHIGGIRISRLRRSAPGKVWLSDRCKIKSVTRGCGIKLAIPLEARPARARRQNRITAIGRRF